MSDISPASAERLVEALRQRERLLEVDLAEIRSRMDEIRARLDEVRVMLEIATSRPRGRPRTMRGVRGDEPLPPPAGLPLQSEEPPPEAA